MSKHASSRTPLSCNDGKPSLSARSVVPPSPTNASVRGNPVKARGKVTQKLTRDGLVERNAATGEEERISKRSSEFDLRGEHSDTPQAIGRRASCQIDTRLDGKQSARQRNRAAYRQAKQDAPRQTPENTQLLSDSPVADAERGSFDDSHSTVLHVPLQQESGTPNRPPGIPAKPLAQDSPAPTPSQSGQHEQRRAYARERNFTDPQSDVQPQSGAVRPRQPTQTNSGGTTNIAEAVQETATPKLQTKRASKLQSSGDSAMKFDRDAKPPQGKAKHLKQRSDWAKAQEQPITDAAQGQTTTPNAPSSTVIPIVTSDADAPESALQFDKPDKLHFADSELREPITSSKPRQRAAPQNNGAAQITQSADISSDKTRASPLKVPESALRFDEPDKLHFAGSEPSEPITPPKPKQRPAPQNDDMGRIAQDANPAPSQSADSPSVTAPATTNHSPLKEPESALKPQKPSKLQFTADETPSVPSRAEIKQQKRYGKAQAQADKSVRKLETAQSQLPAKRRLRSERVFDEETGRAKTKLRFESAVKSQAEHLKGPVPLRPVKAVGNSALVFGHRKIYQVERENVATEAAHKGEIFVEGLTRTALRHHKLAPYRRVQKLERTARKKTINAAYQKALTENPKLKSNALSRALQKRKIKKDYAKATREAQKAAKRAKKAGGAAADAGKALAGAARRHPVATAVIMLILLLLFCLMSLIGAFGSAGSGGLGGILSASYLAEDADIDNAELSYTEWETDLQTRTGRSCQIANAESTHSGYDEYRYNIGEISHNPYELMAYLTVKYQNFSYAAIQGDLLALFNEQYTLTFTPSVETKYADPSDSNEDGDYEPYDWNVMTVTLTARNFTDVIAARMSGDELAHYAILMQTKGARQYLANPFADTNWLPYVTSNYGYRIHPISGAVDIHRGVDIGMPLGTEIHSGQDGTVTFAGVSGDYGNVVVIESDDGLVSKYAHCDTISVTVGQTVKTGDVIATVGSTGNSTGPHLHLEILKNGDYVNPLYFCDSGSFVSTPTYGYAGAAMGDGSYAALMAVALQFENWPYVWGGSTPETSFDCSGLVSFCLRESGVKDVGRLGAWGLYNICTPVSPSEAMPGDLIFFHSTYSTSSPVTHVGIYCGDNLMYDAGNPIGYTRIDTTYWQQHFYAFGRIS